MGESEMDVTIPTPLMRCHTKEGQGKRWGAKGGQTQKAPLAALEAEIDELRVWKAQMIQGVPNLLVNTATQPHVDQLGILAPHEIAVAQEAGEPVPLGSQPVMGDLRHSLQAQGDSQ